MPCGCETSRKKPGAGRGQPVGPSEPPAGTSSADNSTRAQPDMFSFLTSKIVKRNLLIKLDVGFWFTFCLFIMVASISGNRI